MKLITFNSSQGSCRPGRRRLSGRRPHRSGYLYIAVLFTALVVMAAVTTSLAVSTASLRGESDRTSRGDALRLAEAEIQRLAAIMSSSAAWRSELSDNAFSAWTTPSVDGTVIDPQYQVRHRYHDADGVLDDDPWDPVELTVHAKAGRAEAAVRVELEPNPAALDVLDYAVTATNNLRFESGGTLSCERPVQVEKDCVTGSSGTLTTPRLECDGKIEMDLRGDLVGANVGSPDLAIDLYLDAGTEIPFDAIPESNKDLLIQDVILSASTNPFGPVDPNGIYWIDADGDRLILEHCRINATLAVIDASEVRIQGGIHWDHPAADGMILVTDAKIRLLDVESVLDENARSINFNPPSDPFRGVSDGDTGDQYPSQLRGIIHTSENIRIDPLVGDARLHLAGSMTGRTVRIDGHLFVTPLAELLDDPPMGLADPTPLRFVQGTFRRIATP